MRRAILMAVAVAAGALAAACSTSNASVQASGVRGERSFDVGAFETVELAGSHNVVVTVGGAPSVRAEGDTALLDRLEVRVEGGRLKIGTERGWSFSGTGERLTVYVTAPALRGAAIAGSGDMRVGALQTDRFSGEIAGSGNLALERLQAQAAEFSIAGSGDIRAAGQAREARLSIAGSGNADLGGLDAQDANVSIAGSGDASLRATGTASVSIMGSGDVSIAGGARCSVNKMGSGEVRCV